MVANFCYGLDVRLSPDNVAAVRCAAAFLRMDEASHSLQVTFAFSLNPLSSTVNRRRVSEAGARRVFYCLLVSKVVNLPRVLRP